MEIKLMLITLLVLCGLMGVFAADCTFNLDTSSPTYPPHIVDPTAGKIIQPVLINGARIVTVPVNQPVTIACEGSANALSATNAQTATATCTPASATKLSIGTKALTYYGLGCKAQPKETLVEAGACEMGGTLVQIGWQVASQFIKQITICHVKSTANTLYAIDTIYGKNIAADDTANTRPDFRKGNYYSGIDVATAYTQANQIATIGSAYIDVANSFYFARGHLSPDGDFVDAASQDATYYYINAAPQWQSFNNGNWKEAELAVRNVATARQKDFVTYTGTYGILMLGIPQKPIYLAKDANNNDVVPAPKYYWKVVHDPAANQAVAIIGINNPYSAPSSDVFCTDVCSQITWLPLKDRMQVSKGYTFCCTAQDLRNVVSYAPNLNLPLLI